MRLVGEHVSIVFSSEIRALTEQNSSFDKGILRVCYTGKNHNGSFISKETFEKCMPSIYNCPIVCRYDRETDTIGAHDVDVVRTADGGLRMINVTQPVGVIPTGANYWWEEVEEDNGDVHEYLYTEALLWKRQEAYQKIKQDGTTAESMELNIKSSKMVDGVLHINDFEFTAFCLLGTVKPCFESASLELFALDEFKCQMTEMMDELKASFNLMQSSAEADIDNTFSSKGGSTVLEIETEVIETQEAEPVEPVVEEPAVEAEPVVNEAVETAAEFSEEATEEVEEVAVEETTEEHEPDAVDFALEGQIREMLCEAIEGAEMVSCEWGEWPRYWFTDYDKDLGEVYAFDGKDRKLYGFKYSMNGDNVVVDFESKSRKKWAIEDFDEGDETIAFSEAPRILQDTCAAIDAAWSEKYEALSAEVNELKKFKLDTEADAVFSNFSDLEGIDAFENLKNEYANFSKGDLEEKCYAIRGRNGTAAKFSLETPTTKMVVETPADDDEPYGGIFIEYGKK